MTHLRLTPEDYAKKQAANLKARTADRRKGVFATDFNPGCEVGMPKPQKTRQRSLGKPSKASEGEEILFLQLKSENILFQREYRFAAPRKWRADFAFLDDRLLVEVEGGHWSNGRHNRGSGFEADIEKYNAATMLNWALLRFTTKQVKDGTALRTIKQYLER